MYMYKHLINRHSHRKMATETVIIIFLTLSLLSASVTASVLSASQALNLHGGYSITATSLSSLSSTPSLYNATGTLLAPPDSSLSLLLPRPTSLSLLLSHTFRNPPSLSSPTAFQTIHPYIYRDPDFIVHGIDRVLAGSRPDPTVDIRSRLLNRTARVLRRKGFGVMSIGLSVRKPDLLRLDGITLFSTPDRALFSGVDGFSYDFLRHVAPKRYSPDEVRVMGTVETLSKTMAVGPDDGFFEVYSNRWIVVIGVTRPIGGDEVAGSCGRGVYGEEDYRSCDVEGSGALISEKVVESAPSHQVNGEPLDGRIIEETTVEMVRRKVRELSGVDRNREAGPKIVPFQVADDLFYYT